MANVNDIILVDYAGYNDGYYWDERVFFSVNNENFVFINVGSGSGWIPNFEAIAYYNGEELLEGERLSEYKSELGEESISSLLSYLAQAVDRLKESGEQEVVLYGEES